MKLLPIRNLPLFEEVLQQLTLAIEEGELRLGEFLPPERELAAKLGVSRAVIREAAKCLEQRGLVRIRQGVGVEVVNNPSLPVQNSLLQLKLADRERIYQCAQARLLIEPEIAAAAALNSTPGAIERLNANMKSVVEENDLDVAVNLDIEFHQIIADLAGNQVLSLILKSMAELGRLSRKMSFMPLTAERATAHHLAIIAAIESSDADAARRAMKEHMLSMLEECRALAHPRGKSTPASPRD
jgi:GntR family transcriptional repressor for pyruvate dehydrogenase complex